MKEENLSANLARNLVKLRQGRGVTQHQLARAARMPRSTLNQLESGAGNPSLRTLVRVSQALRVSLEELLSTSAGEVRKFVASELPLRVKGGGKAKVFDMLPDPVAGLELERLEINRGGGFAGVPHLSGTKEYFLCLSGAAQVIVEGQAFVLHEGEMLVFRADVRHSYKNVGSTRLIAVSMVVLGR